MSSKHLRPLPAILNSQKGSSLIELAIAMLLTSTILIGGVQFFFGGKKLLQSARIRRLAAMHLNERAEYLRHLAYSLITIDLNENQQPVQLDKYQLWRSTTIQFIDDPLDGVGSGDSDGNPVDYKKIHLTVNWSDRPADRFQVTLIVCEDYQL